MEHIFFSPIEKFVTLNENSVKALKRLGISNIRDLLFYLPNSYQVKSISPNLSTLQQGQLIQVEVVISDIHIPSNPRSPIRILAQNESGNILLIFFNKIPSFIFHTLQIGSKHTISGKVQFFDNMPQINHPEFIIRKELESPLEPLYSLTYALNNKQLYYYICKVLEAVEMEFAEADEQTQNSIADIILNLQTIHLYHFQFQVNEIPTYWQKARKNLAEVELLVNQASLKAVRQSRHIKSGRSFSKAAELQQKILHKLGFELTISQQEAIAEIEKDQVAEMQMLRLLQGDVGSGKTLVALLTMLNVVNGIPPIFQELDSKIRSEERNVDNYLSTRASEILENQFLKDRRYQAAFMAPTDLLANQHYGFFTAALEDEGINIALLTGKTSAKERQMIAAGLKSGEIHILIGTHALFQENVEFKDLAYVVIDEQHKFGVEQRTKLINKASHPDLLVMTATPIPRSLTLTMFGDMEVSNLKMKPKNRLPIITNVTSNKKISEVITALERKIAQGEKIYWVCPLIESKEEVESSGSLKDVIARFMTLQEYYGDKVGLIHGKMKAKEKDLIMAQFKQGTMQILVATTVIEVGIDISDATLMVIENAEQFGLAQLHQLRGRVGRGNIQSHCILIYNYLRFTEQAKSRLNIMRTSNDGFYIAEQDMLLRGSGEILGAKQSGEPEFFFVNLKEDIEELIKVNQNVAELQNFSPSAFLMRLFTKGEENLLHSG